jgi:hypothetical protein
LKDGICLTQQDAVAYANRTFDASVTPLGLAKYFVFEKPPQETEMRGVLSHGHFCYYVGESEFDTDIYEMLYRCIYNNYKTTLFTFFFNLKELDDSSPSTRPTSFYMANGKATLQQKQPMVIFCDEKYLEDIKALRNSVCPVNQTHYVVKNLTDYDIFRTTKDIIVANRKKLGFYPDGRASPSYTVAMVFKIIALRLTHGLDIFKTKCYAWVDFGCSHICDGVATSIAEIVENPKPRATFTYIHYRSHAVLEDMDGFMKYGNPTGIAGGFFTVEHDYVVPFYCACLSIYHEMLYKGVGHSDEAIFTYCYDRHPEMFTLNYGDYYSLFTNYFHVTRDYACIRNYFLRSCLSAGRADLAAGAASAVLASEAAGKLTLGAEDRKYLQSLVPAATALV